ncbi:MAG: hypothetical protein CBC65_001905 [Rhodothermaceae bacterium TMED105]|jgi:hypothetical protein|nr:MAG: hypothetical protein CBC65_001905 [Rhodothermaceae bacterium TMED105]|tara:strand:- start:6810 stop:7184 length:375 start_codon:yes stop_codon:yes gene_type:complete
MSEWDSWVPSPTDRSAKRKIDHIEDGEIEEVLPRDHTLYLARKIPRMCLPRNHSLFAFTHETMLQYIGTSEALYDEVLYYPPCEDSTNTYVMDVEGSRLHDMFPQFSNIGVRRKSMYSVVCVVH